MDAAGWTCRSYLWSPTIHRNRPDHGNRPGSGAITRRGAIGLIGGAGLMRLVRPAAAADAFPQAVVVIVAGPPGGGLDDASQTLLAGLKDHLPPGTSVGANPIGGVDGVTGANHFATQTAPDGGAALLVPGAASIAWMVGDSRVHFDPSRWVPVLAQVSPAVVVGRAGLGRLRPGMRLRVAMGTADSPALAALLALDLLGVTASPVYGLNDEAAALTALAAGRADAALLRRSDAIGQLGAGSPAAALFSFGRPDATGADQREPEVPDVPTLLEYAARLDRGRPDAARYAAWRCAASAAQLQYALVLPTLTPPSAVALWREAAAHVPQPDPAMAGQLIYAPAAAELMQSLAPDGTALLDLRGWLASSLGWQPG